VGSDTETVHIFQCSVPKPGTTKPANWGGSWSGPNSPESAVDGDDMDRVIEGKRRNGSMGYDLLCDETNYSSKIRKGSQSLTKQFATSLAPLLPTSVTEIWEPSRDLAHIKIPQKTSGITFQ
jgi:autophagy-related protein 18